MTRTYSIILYVRHLKGCSKTGPTFGIGTHLTPNHTHYSNGATSAEYSRASPSLLFADSILFKYVLNDRNLV